MGQQHSSVIRLKKRRLRPNLSSSTSSQPITYDAFRWVDSNPIYAMPANETEYTWLNSQHFQIRYVFQGDYQAPLTEELTRGIKVLDTGCGTGVWSLEMARKFPASSFIGSDIVNRFKGMKTPDNVTFTIADTLALPFEEGTFDFVFQRQQILSFSESKWPKVIEELLRVTKPGGTIELIENDVHVHDAGPATATLYKLIGQAMKIRGINPRIASLLRPMFETAGLEDIKMDYRSIPVGWGPEVLGPQVKASLFTALSEFKDIVVSTLDIGEEEYDELVAVSLNETGNEYKSYINMTSIVGKKSAKVKGSAIFNNSTKKVVTSKIIGEPATMSLGNSASVVIIEDSGYQTALINEDTKSVPLDKHFQPSQNHNSETHMPPPDMKSPEVLVYQDEECISEDDDTTISEDEPDFYEWLDKPLVEKHQKDDVLVELHQLGKKFSRILPRDLLVSIAPTYLLDDIGWYTDQLGIYLHVRKRLPNRDLQEVKRLMEGSRIFHGVEELVVRNDATFASEVNGTAIMVSGAGGEDGEPSDDSDENDEGDDIGPKYDQMTNRDGNPIHRARGPEGGSGKGPAGLPQNCESNAQDHSSSGSSGVPDHNVIKRSSSDSKISTSPPSNTRGRDEDNSSRLPQPDASISGRPAMDLSLWKLVALFLCLTLFLLRLWSTNPDLSAPEKAFYMIIETSILFLFPFYFLMSSSHVTQTSQSSAEVIQTPSNSSDDRKPDDDALSGISGNSQESSTTTQSATTTDCLPPPSSNSFQIAEVFSPSTENCKSPSRQPVTTSQPDSIKSTDTKLNDRVATNINVSNEAATKIEQGHGLFGVTFGNNTSLSYTINNQGPTAASKAKDSKPPNLTIHVTSESKATLKNVNQEFTMHFTVKVTATDFSHKFELSNIRLGGGIKQLIERKRYYFKNFNVKISPIEAKIKCCKINPERDETHDHWRIQRRYSLKEGIEWCSIINDPFEHNVLHWSPPEHLVEYEWDGTEPTEYLIHLRLGLGFKRHPLSLQYDHDLVYSVSIRVKDIRKHDKVDERLGQHCLCWNVAKKINNCTVETPRNTKHKENRREWFIHSSFLNCRCCKFAARICTVGAETELLT